VNESINIKIQFKPQAADISTDELALLESILPDLIHTMMQIEALKEVE
jgi:hypothetical protein